MKIEVIEVWIWDMKNRGPQKEKMIGTTVIVVRRKGKVAMAGDGQVTIGNTVMKHGAKKVRRLYKDQVIAGFAGATADAFTLLKDLKIN